MWAGWLARRLHAAVVAAVGIAAIGSPAEAYLYWKMPDFSGRQVRGDEPGIALPLPDATPAEIQANLVWTMRAALNVAALQCQFSPPLMTVRNYNSLLSQHGTELAAAYKTIGNYFKRTLKKNWQRSFDEYTTRTYNGLSTMHAQIGFCETAGKVGKLALEARRGTLHDVAAQSMQEIRNSLVPVGDMFFAARTYLAPRTLPPLEDRCWDKKGVIKKKCVPPPAGPA
jgi:hypothetical protein